MKAKSRIREGLPYPYGVAYYRPPTPLPKYWTKDLENIRKSGFNTIRANAFWSWIEPSEREFDFSELDELCHLTQKNNLKILLTTYMVSAPEWMFEKYPKSRFISASGRVVNSNAFPDVPAGGWPGLCFDSPHIKEKGTIFLEKVTEHFRNNPTILAFDVMHEPTEEPTQMYYVDSWKEKLFCYCPYTIDKFRAWLKDKYGSLDQLNKAWARRFSKWGQIFPPRNFGVYADWLDWRTFSIDALTEELMWRAKTVKKYDPNRLVVTHAYLSHPFISATDNFKLARAVDIYGASFYNVDEPVIASLEYDFVRSASKEKTFWVGEMSGGSGPMFPFIGEPREKTYPFGLPISPEKIAKHAWQAVAHGAKGLIYWMWRPEVFGGETAAMGFTDREGNLTKRVKAANMVSRTIMENKELFIDFLPPKSEVAIFYNIDSFLYEGLVSLVKYLGKEKRDVASLVGAYKFFWEKNVPVDFVSKEDVLAGKLKEYKLLVMPYSISISRSLGEKVKDFAREGGTVFSEALCGFFTDGGWGSERTPGAGLDEVFCCKVNSYKMTQDCEIKIKPNCSEFSHLADNDPMIGNLIQESLEIKKSGKTVGIFEDGSPAIVYGKYGLGRAIYAGTVLTIRRTETPDASVRELIDQLLTLSGIKKQITITKVDPNSCLETRVLEGNGKYLLFVLNHNPIALSTQISVEVSFVPCSVTDLNHEERISYAQHNGIITIDLSMNSYEVRLLKVSPIH